MGVHLLIDSTADLHGGLREALHILPVTIRFGEEEYLDGITISNKEFYYRLLERKVIPTTSLVTPFAFEQACEELTSHGDSVVILTISGKLSGTYQSAVIAAQRFEGKVFVIDSKSVSIGTGILIEYALSLIGQGLPAAEIACRLEQERDNVHVLAVLDTLEYLKLGGRISKAAALAGDMLSIKPVVCLDGGEVSIVGKVRGMKQASNQLIREIERSGVNLKRPILMGYTGLEDDGIRKFIEESKSVWKKDTDEIPYALIGSAVGTHAGPGCVAAAFFKD